LGDRKGIQPTKKPVLLIPKVVFPNPIQLEEECREGTALPRFGGKTTVKSEGGGSSCELFFHVV